MGHLSLPYHAPYYWFDWQGNGEQPGASLLNRNLRQQPDIDSVDLYKLFDGTTIGTLLYKDVSSLTDLPPCPSRGLFEPRRLRFTLNTGRVFTLIAPHPDALIIQSFIKDVKDFWATQVIKTASGDVPYTVKCVDLIGEKITSVGEIVGLTYAGVVNPQAVDPFFIANGKSTHKTTFNFGYVMQGKVTTVGANYSTVLSGSIESDNQAEIDTNGNVTNDGFPTPFNGIWIGDDDSACLHRRAMSCNKSLNLTPRRAIVQSLTTFGITESILPMTGLQLGTGCFIKLANLQSTVCIGYEGESMTRIN